MCKYVQVTSNKNAKKCPLFYPHSGKYVNNPIEHVGDCIKGDCMFWNDKAQDCNINVLAKKL